METKTCTLCGATDGTRSIPSWALRLSNLDVIDEVGSGETNFGYMWVGGVVPITDIITGTPKIQIGGGKLTIEFDTPKSEKMRSISIEAAGSATITNDAESYLRYDFCNSDASHQLVCSDGTDSDAGLIYVDANVTINGNDGSGNTFSNDSLKKGWNFIVYNNSSLTYTSASKTLPAGFAWRIIY